MNKKTISIAVAGASIVIAGVYGFYHLNTENNKKTADQEAQIASEEGGAIKGYMLADELANKMGDQILQTGTFNREDYKRIIEEKIKIGDIKRILGLFERNTEMTYAHVVPGEYSEIYVVMTGLLSGDRVTARLYGGDHNGTPQVVDVDKNGVAHFTWRISKYGSYHAIASVTEPVAGASKIDMTTGQYPPHLFNYYSEQEIARLDELNREDVIQIGYADVNVQ